VSTNSLFEPIQIGDVELKNRIVMSPMNMGYTGPDGYASEQTYAWYATRAPEFVPLTQLILGIGRPADGRRGRREG
jgi:2,4-dienoyl-CoA reductase-like NADH-dependent reductase (Old Yellow Enzyme family)